jgi:hypothetical protein
VSWRCSHPWFSLSDFQEKEVLTDGHFYMGIESGGQDISSILPGKHWVEIPVPVGGGGSSGTGTSDPIAQLQLLAANGNQVAALGTKVIDGETDSGYAVTITRQNVLNGIQKFNVSSGLDAAAQQQLSQAAQNTPVSISAPLADDVATYNQFLAAEGTSSASEG